MGNFYKDEFLLDIIFRNCYNNTNSMEENKKFRRSVMLLRRDKTNKLLNVCVITYPLIINGFLEQRMYYIHSKLPF